MDVEPDYSNYSIIELFEALEQLDDEQYPGRRDKIKALINGRLHDNPAVSEECLLKSADEFSFFVVWRRLLAFCVDAVIIALVGYYIYSSVTYIDPQRTYDDIALGILVISGGLVVYNVVCLGLFRQTVGKYLLGLIVSDIDSERRASFQQLVTRDCFLYVSALYGYLLYAFWVADTPFSVLPDFFVLVSFVVYVLIMSADVLAAYLSDKRQTLHDRLAKTVVMRKE
ncbi:hypothetical protein CS022_11105 [Veronia nyctiphanis]|uniref:RDD domain-containing protein n=1 Tax=Veronia nyctiphanis TaxID=1278244 RepID=A0A4Q0YVS3_9GAMM|nr:RDD family protein [Veronia nyctiphanis]RXJ73269.1 hypothetical protein CS022_11105 [Veronia nyctiphanis]